jgi:hypothetical protein
MPGRRTTPARPRNRAPGLRVEPQCGGRGGLPPGGQHEGERRSVPGVPGPRAPAAEPDLSPGPGLRPRGVRHGPVDLQPVEPLLAARAGPQLRPSRTPDQARGEARGSMTVSDRLPSLPTGRRPSPRGRASCMSGVPAGPHRPSGRQGFLRPLRSAGPPEPSAEGLVAQRGRPRVANGSGGGLERHPGAPEGVKAATQRTETMSGTPRLHRPWNDARRNPRAPAPRGHLPVLRTSHPGPRGAATLSALRLSPRGRPGRSAGMAGRPPTLSRRPAPGPRRRSLGPPRAGSGPRRAGRPAPRSG